MTNIKENLYHIQEKIHRTCLRSGRDPDTVRLVAVSKKQPVEAIMEAMAAGHTLFGENYVQEAQEKIERIDGARWHFIGHVQSNKAKTVAALFDCIHTVDRLKLAKALDKQAGALGKVLTVLVQINVGEERQKSGVLPEKAEQLLTELRAFANLRVRGLMTMPPYKSDPEEVRSYFRTLREMADNFRDKGCFAGPESYELSMGMSGDFEVAIEEGATLVRIGTSLFGPRLA